MPLKPVAVAAVYAPIMGLSSRSPAASGGSGRRRATTSTLSQVGPASVTGSRRRARRRRVARSPVSSDCGCASSSDAANTSGVHASAAMFEYAP